METGRAKSYFFRKAVILLCLFPTLECLGTSEALPFRRSSHILSQPPSSPRVPGFKDPLRRVLLGLLFGSLSGLFLAVLFVLVIRFFIQYVNRMPILKGPVIFSPKISPRTLLAALSNESQLLGSSPNGKYYRVVLENGLVVAVKRFEPLENGAPEVQRKSVKRQIQRELELLALLRHRNLMSLRAYVRGSDHRFSLVYDYVPTGNLEDVMNRVRAKQLQLKWEIRHRIAVGIIMGLRYLHFGCSPRILHHDLKPTNVLLDEEFEPRLGDCGLANLMPHAGRGMLPYVAPECLQSSRYTDKSDVFSFGVILAVLLTGKDPLDPFFSEMGGGSICRWLRHLQQAGEARKCLDKSLLGEEVEEDEMLMAVRIAVVCLSDLPADRPSSDELVPMLTELHSL
ncbi:inactive leucine-rich repeat receptor-like protein kinase CORYNE [Aristolochia californica]|uniref:inactive leucine-rich repeat receptor-like protein kinase CORYNE n=1 Tax=Aristolochia californica TaxID=171875 RepID=UPI0035DC12DF